MLSPVHAVGSYFVLVMLSACLQGLVLARMTQQKQYRDFPWFYSYLALVLSREAVSYWLLYFKQLHWVGYAAYFFTYWGTQLVFVVLAFAVIYEVFEVIFEPYEGLRTLGRRLFLVGIVLALSVTMLMAWMTPGTAYARGTTLILLMHRSDALFRCAMLAMLFLMSKYLALRWRSQVLGIALGLGLTGAADLVLAAAHLFSGADTSGNLWIPAIATLLSAGIWTIYFMLPEPAVAALPAAPRLPLQEWNTRVTELLSR